MSNRVYGRIALEAIEDVQAEREAAAVAWMEENELVPVQRSRLDIERGLRELAQQLGLPPVKHVRYPRQASVKAWIRIIEAFSGNRAPATRRPKLDLTTSADRARRKAVRLATGRSAHHYKLVSRSRNGTFAAA